MYSRLLAAITFFCVVAAVPALGGGKNIAAGGSVKQNTVTTPPVITISPKGYTRDPGRIMQMRQYEKSLHQMQQQAAANRAAARTKAAIPQKTEGGTQ